MIDDIVSALAAQGWACAPGFIAPALVAGLAADARTAHAQGRFRPAAVGRGDGRVIDPAQRGDVVLWLDPAAAAGARLRWLQRMETLRLALNEALFLGLFDLEAHYALYAPGAGYRRHRDQHRGQQTRLLSVIAYLNEDWGTDDGGALRLYLDAGDAHVDVLPRAGTLAVFLADRYDHEVLPARRERLALTGWFRGRPQIPL